jgi:hypothetical protein
MKFACMGYGIDEKWDALSKREQDAILDDCFTYDNKLLKNGNMLEDGAALQPSRTAKTLRWRNGKVLVTDGPYAETKEQLGGFGVVEARDMDHAVELLSKHPGLQYDVTFEIRPIDEPSLKRQEASLARVRSSAPAVDPQAAKFATLGYINEADWGSMPKSEFDTMMNQCVELHQARVKCGQWVSGIGLLSARTAKTLRSKAGKVIVTDGPFAETKEYLGGVAVLALKDFSDAVRALSQHPALPFGMVIEIRPIDEEVFRRWEAKLGTVVSA